MLSGCEVLPKVLILATSSDDFEKLLTYNMPFKLLECAQSLSGSLAFDTLLEKKKFLEDTPIEVCRTLFLAPCSWKPSLAFFGFFPCLCPVGACYLLWVLCVEALLSCWSVPKASKKKSVEDTPIQLCRTLLCLYSLFLEATSGNLSYLSHCNSGRGNSVPWCCAGQEKLS